MKKVRSLSVKSLSVFLAIIITLFSLPLTAFAVSFEQTPPSSEESSETRKEIIELRELRNENTKYFRLEDGTFYAAQYDSAVHYMDENGEWQDVDNTLSASGDTYATNDQKIKFAKKTNGNGEIFTLHDGNRKLTLSLQGANKKVKGVVTNNETEFSDDTPKITKMTTLDKISASIVYQDILENTDLEYVVNSGNIKENIIVKAKSESYNYVFSMSLNNLSATMSADGGIDIKDPSTGELVYRIPAPFMYDAGGAYSQNVTLTLEENGGNGKYTLTVTADDEWINAEGREFPVTIDPPLVSGHTNSEIDCTYIDSADPYAYHDSDAYLYLSNGKRIYWKNNNLPQIPSSAYITFAEFTIRAKDLGGMTGGYVGAYEVTTDWYGSLCWSDLSDGGVGLISSDYTDFCEVRGGSYSPVDYDFTFNIFPIVKNWYDGENYGLALEPVAGETFNGSVQFCSDDYTTASEVPTLTISYRDMKGLESYWTAASQSAGFAGSGAVNLATGSLVVSIPTLTTTDALMPISPALVYNYVVGPDSYAGSNFALNLCESITAGTYTDTNGTQKTHYKWIDSDGTEHYFMPTAAQNVYADEDGLLLTLNVLSSGYTITDDNDTVRTFDFVGRLTQITDKSGNSVIFELNAAGLPSAVKLLPNGNSSQIEQLRIGYSGGKLSYVLNPNSNEAAVIRYSANRISSVLRVRGIGASESEIASFAASSATYGTGNIAVDATASYAYASDGRITSVINEMTGYQITYSYDSSGRVIEVSEFGGYSEGQTVGFEYGTTNTVVRTSGGDDSYGTYDDLLTTYVFDSFGRTVSTYATDTSGTVLHGAASAQYVDSEENEKAQNSIKQSVSVSDLPANLIYNGGFENGLVGWQTVGTVVAEDGYHSAQAGAGYAKISGASTIYQIVTLSEGYHTFSAYVNAYNSAGASVELKAVSLDSSSNSATAEIPTSSSSIGDNYTFGSVGFYASANERFALYIDAGQSSSGASVRVDSAMLSRSTGAASFSAVDFGSFESTSTSATVQQKWIKYSTETDEPTALSENITTAYTNDLFGNSLKMEGGIGNNVTVRQRIYEVTAEKKDDYRPHLGTGVDKIIPLVLSGWAKSNALSYNSESTFEIRAVVSYYDGSSTLYTETSSVSFDKSITGWQFATGSFEINPSRGLVNSVDIEIVYDNNPGTAYFDNITLVSGEGSVESYKYNSRGYVTELTYGGNAVWHIYGSDGTSENVTKVVNQNGTATSYSYDSYGRVIEEISGTHNERITFNTSTGQINDVYITAKTTTSYSYDNYGLCTTRETSSIDGKTRMTTVYDTDADSHLFGAVKIELDPSSGTTHYFHDENSGRLLAVTDPDGNGVCYSYDGMGNITLVLPAQYVDTSDIYGNYSANTNAESAAYTYDGANRLSRITTESTVYNFSYDSFGNTQSIGAGNSTLASYSYNSSNGKLARISYGNGFAVNYYYDALDRISEIVYNKNGSYETVMSYTYDSGGRLYSSTDHRTGETVRYDYDPSGKLLASYVANSSGDVLGGASYEYDENGRISASDVRTDVSGSVEREELSYSYNRDGNLSLRVSVNGALVGNITPTYDNLGRTVQRTLDYSAGGDVFYGKVSYSYLHRTGYDSALVSQYTFERGISGTLTSSTYNFEYDLAGNITQITDGSNVIQNKYYYDDLYQLIREDNRALGKTYVWTYDNAGNILSKTTYAFTTGALGTALETLTYTYSNGSWGDQLTSVGGWTYTYDAIGNPISKTNTNGESVVFTWSGRELTSWYLYDDGELVKPMSFTYNADGIRTSKSYYDEVTEYILDGTCIVAEIKNDSHVFVYIYDELGLPIGIKYRTTTNSSYEYFFFEKNLQGDIVAIYNDSGTKIATYTYDAWGNFTKSQTSGITYSTADSYVYNNNPFTYRGYYYDTETGLYYLQTRYYDASIGRFISADGYVSTGQGFTGNNVYAYCGNNPAILVDFYGEDAIYVTDYKTLPWLGHSLLLIQDNQGEWYFTEYGLGAQDVVRTFRLEDKYQDNPYKYLDENYTTLKPRPLWLIFTFEKYEVMVERVSKYQSLYIKGDFSKAVDLAKDYKITGFGGYNPFTHNCLHYVQKLLKSGYCYDWSMQNAIKNQNGFLPRYYIGDLQSEVNSFSSFLVIRWLGW